MGPLGAPDAWFPTPLEIGVFLTVWPLIFALAVSLALVVPMWLIRVVVGTARWIRRRR